MDLMHLPQRDTRVTRGSEKPLPTRHKISTDPPNPNKPSNLSPAKIIHTDTSPTRCHREARGPEKPLPTRLPTPAARPHPTHTKELNQGENKYARRPASPAGGLFVP